MSTKTAIAIARVSTDEQAGDDRTSLDTQLAEVEAWCASNGYQVIERIREEGVSVTGDLDPDTHPRPLWDAYSRLRDGEVDVIVFLSRDRLSRSRQMHAVVGLLAEARTFGDGIRFAQGGGTGDADMDFIMDAVTALSVKQDADRRKEATLRGQRARFEAGEVGSGLAPLGYQYDSTKRHWELNEAEAEIVRLIFHLYVVERLGMTALTRRLNDDGIATTRSLRGGGSQRWSTSMIHTILHRECYSTGTHHRALGDVTYEIPVPAIVAAEVFARAQEIAEARPNFATDRVIRTTQPGVRTGQRGLLQGLLTCGLCGRGLRVNSDIRRGSRKGGAPGIFEPVYVCAGRDNRTGGGGDRCDLPRLNGPRLDERLWGELLDVVRDGSTFKEAALAHAERIAARLTELDPELRRAQRAVRELEEEHEGLLLGFGQARTDAARSKLQQRLDTLVRDIEEARQPLIENTTLIARQERLASDRTSLLAAIERYGGEFTIEDEAEMVFDEEASTPEQPVYRPRLPDEPFDPRAEVMVRYRGTADPGSERPSQRLGIGGRMSRQDFVDLLQIKGTAWPDRLRVEGIVLLDVPLGGDDGVTPPYSLSQMPQKRFGRGRLG